MEMGERSKGKSYHASSYASSRADRFHGGVAPNEAYWKYQRGYPSLPNWPRERRQAGGTDNPGNYYIPDPHRRHKKLIPPDSSHLNYSSIDNAETQYRCPQTHRVTRNKTSIGNNLTLIRKANEFKADAENDADEDENDDEDLGDEQYYEDEAPANEEEENQEESCGSETEKEPEDLEADDYEISPPVQQFRKKYGKDPMAIMERLKMLDLAQERLKFQHERHFQKKYHEMLPRRAPQDIQDHDVTDEATEDDEISPDSYTIRKMMKPTNVRQPNSWVPSRNPEKYSAIRPPQNYQYLRKSDTIKPSLELPLDPYGQKRTCRYCGGTGSYPEPVVPRKNNCRVPESTKVSFNTKEKFGVDGESGDPGERCSNGRRNSPRLNLVHSPAALPSQKPRRSRIARSPNRG